MNSNCSVNLCIVNFIKTTKTVRALKIEIKLKIKKVTNALINCINFIAALDLNSNLT